MAANSPQMSSKTYAENPGLREISTPYNPQQNGIAKEKNITIMEATKAMLHDQDLPLHLWAKAARTIAYLQNRIPHRVLNNKTPKEVFSRKKTEVGSEKNK